jgi:hypothetical protein
VQRFVRRLEISTELFDTLAIRRFCSVRSLGRAATVAAADNEYRLIPFSFGLWSCRNCTREFGKHIGRKGFDNFSRRNLIGEVDQVAGQVDASEHASTYERQQLIDLVHTAQPI